ncbi:unnamed protein product, partial [Musa textilis]
INSSSYFGTQSINVILYFTVVLPSMHSYASSVPVLSGSNYSEWLEHVQFTLGVLDLDLALLVEKPADLTDNSSVEQVNEMKAWQRSDRLSLMFIRMTIANNIKTSLPIANSAQ